MLKFISKLVGSKSDRDLKLLQPFVDAINSHTDAVAALSNDGLREKTAGFKMAIESATAALESEKAALYEQIAATENYDAREPLYEQIEATDKDVLQEIERVLLEVHPEAFAVVRETAKRFTAGEVRATATELDRELAQKFHHITIEGDEVVYANS